MLIEDLNLFATGKHKGKNHGDVALLDPKYIVRSFEVGGNPHQISDDLYQYSLRKLEEYEREEMVSYDDFCDHGPKYDIDD